MSCTQPRLSVHDGFAFALAETHPGCILLTGDSVLRVLAECRQIEVHGILRVCDQIFECHHSTAEELHAALLKLAANPAVRLPKCELAGYIRRYQLPK